jgi:hypothetical protein
MRTDMRTWPKLALAVAGTVAAMGLWAAQARGAAALWISAPTWSYSAAAAQSPIGGIYFWAFSVGAGTYSWAGAFSNDGAGDAAYAFAEAAAGRGGLAAVLVTGAADPWASESIDVPNIDPSLSGSFPTSKPGADPFSSTYTVDGSGIHFPTNESGQELNADFELEAFVYNGSNTETDIEGELGASTDNGTTSAGDVTDFSHLTADLGLFPLDAPMDDSNGLSSLNFNENTGMIDQNFDNVVLVGVSTAAPEPASVVLLSCGLAGLGLYWRRRR